MFFPLSFKKLKRRIRSPFTLLKNKISRKKRNNKQQLRSHRPDVALAEQQSTPIADPVGSLTPSTDTSVASDLHLPPTPVSASGPVACSRIVEYEQHQVGIKRERALDRNVVIDSQALISPEPVPKELAVDVKVKEAKADPIHVEEAEIVVDTKQGGEDYVSPEVLATVCEELTLAKELVSQHEDKIIQDAQIVSQPQVNEVEVKVKHVARLSLTGDAVQAPQLVISDDETPAKQVMEPLLIDSAVEKLQSAGDDNGAAEQCFGQTILFQPAVSRDILTPPATPTRKVTSNVRNTKDNDNFLVTPSVNILTPPTTPRKRVTSDGHSSAKDADILAELQASVRSREKKRIERERAEKERKERERELIAMRAKEISEHGSLICDPEEKDHVLREVRSWRKQREASLKVKPDEEAKNASYRAAFANEEIMTELQNAAQSRSQRAPRLDNLQEKRQLALEELYASRFQAVQV